MTDEEFEDEARRRDVHLPVSNEDLQNNIYALRRQQFEETMLSHPQFALETVERQLDDLQASFKEMCEKLPLDVDFRRRMITERPLGFAFSCGKFFGKLFYRRTI